VDSVPWHALEPARVDATLLAVVKTAALVEANSADYVSYLAAVFADDAAFRAAAERWGEEEAQHGAALARWAGAVDAAFDFPARLARFRAAYRLPPGEQGSVRGSRAGELLARCVVESGTCSFYAALRDASDEPVLRHVCHRIAQDEAAHYLLFRRHLERYLVREPLPRWRRLALALGRVGETDDDELARAFHSANCAVGDVYDRARCAHTYQRLATGLYGLAHVRTVTAMIARASGFDPARWPVRLAGRLGWWALRARARRAAQSLAW